MTTRRVATALLVAGALALAYAVTILVWRDPATDLYTRFQQQRLESALEAELEAWARADDGRGRPAAVDDGADPAEAAKAARAEVRADARRFAGELELGQAFGRIRIPSIDVEAIVVHGTRWGPDLSRGPGHYERTTVPGLGRTVGIAGHRTTFGAPFRHIDDIQTGDEITLDMPYATFRYRVVAHEIVDSDDWSVIRDRGHDTLMLSACHPLYSAAQRWIVYGRLVEVRPRSGDAFNVDAR